MSTKAITAVDRRAETELQVRAAAKMRARGACPALAAPMSTGDGLLVRLRPAGGALTLPQFRALARAAAAHGHEGRGARDQITEQQERRRQHGDQQFDIGNGRQDRE